MNMTMDKIKVFLSDPQILFREGIHFILSGEEDFEVIGETTGNDEAFTLVENNPPNVAILSMNDPKTAGPVITRRIRRNFSSVFVVLTADIKEPEKIFAAIKSGASACITKDTEPEHLLDIIRVAAQGSSPLMEEMLTPSIAAMVIADFEEAAALNHEFENMMAGLTAKEQQILSAISAGGNIEQLTAKLDMNEETIRRNIRLIFNKLISNDQARSVIEAAQRNIPMMLRTNKSNGKNSEYVTRSEFNEFKEQLAQRFKSFIGQLS
jgi:DNA-binding NarL/FixJ family response regulator